MMLTLMMNYYILLVWSLLVYCSDAELPAELCSDNSDICELFTGCYADRDAKSGRCNMPWWAYVPKGSLACPEKGCPLYIWMGGTLDAEDHVHLDAVMQFEMLKRGFVAVSVGYDNSLFEYVNSPGCESNFFFQGIKDKARAIFDSTDDDSVISQICEGSDALANCNLGIATNGYSQGAQLASLAANYDTRVFASLLFGNGIYNPNLQGDYSCLINENLTLRRERRRSITGEDDGTFGDGTLNGVLSQQKKTSGYDCGEQLNCFPSKDGGGYSLVPAEEYADLTLSERFVNGDGHHFLKSFMKKYKADVGFPLIQETEPWGISLNLDWLARTTTRTTTMQASMTDDITAAPTYTPTEDSFPTYSPSDEASQDGSLDVL